MKATRHEINEEKNRKRAIKMKENQIIEGGHCKKTGVNGQLLSEEIRRYFCRKRKRSVRNLLTILAGREIFFNQIDSHNLRSLRSSSFTGHPKHRKDNCCPRLDNRQIKSPPRLVYTPRTCSRAHTHSRYLR